MKNQEEKKDYSEVLSAFKSFAQRSNSYLKDRTQRIKAELEIAGGNMLEEDKKAMEGMPQITMQVLRPYLNQVINRYRQFPFNSMIESKVYGFDEPAAVAQAFVRGVKTKSNIKSIGAVAIDRMVKCGHGYIAITTDYMDASGFDQEIKLSAIHRPDMVIDDPYDQSVDGSAGVERALVQFISESQAKMEFGEKITDYKRGNNAPLFGTLWSAPADSVEVTTYYRLRKESETIYLNENGERVSANEVRKNAKVKTSAKKSREIVNVSCDVYKIIGDTVVSETNLPINMIPVVPFRGEMIDRNGRLDFAGLVYFGKHLAKIADIAINESIVRISKAPRSLFSVDGRSVANYKEQMADNLPRKYLVYDSKDAKTGDSFNAPQLLQVSVDTSDLMTMQTNAMTSLSAVLGMNTAGSEIAGASNQTASEVLTKSKTQELSNYQFLDNASESFKAIDNIIIQLMPTIYDTEREVPMEGENGFEMSTMNMAEQGIEADKLKFSMDAGPMDATERNENLSKMIALTTIDPVQGVKMFPEIVKMSGLPNSDKLYNLIQPQVAGEDPNAIAVMDGMDAKMTEMQNKIDQQSLYIQQLSADRADKSLELQVAREKMASDYKRTIDLELLKQQGALTELQLQMQADANAEFAKQQAETKRLELQQPKFIAVQGAEPSMSAVGGQRNDIF